MFIKLIIALAIILIIMTPSVNIRSSNNAALNYTIKNQMLLIDSSVMHYYITHAGNLPSSLNDIEKLPELQNLDIHLFKYHPQTNSYTLEYTDTNSNIVKSPNSNKSLPLLK